MLVFSDFDGGSQNFLPLCMKNIDLLSKKKDQLINKNKDSPRSKVLGSIGKILSSENLKMITQQSEIISKQNSLNIQNEIINLVNINDYEKKNNNTYDLKEQPVIINIPVELIEEDKCKKE